MRNAGFTGKLFIVFEWITRLAYVNILWIGFTILGLGFAGLFPATSGMFSITRRWVKGEHDFSVFPLFWSTYKRSFWKSNGFGWIMVVLGIILYLDYVFFASSASTLFFLLKSFTLMLLFVYALILTMIFPVFSQYKLKIMHLFRNTVFISMLNPVKSLVTILGAATIGYLMFLFPTLIPFFGGSLIALYISWVAQIMFLKLEQKQQETFRKD